MRSVERRVPGLVLVEHELEVPLDHARPDGERIVVFAREVADPDGRDKPLLLFLQGGPGHEAPRPSRSPAAPAWLERALRDFRVLMLDQRGTGRSTPVGALAGMDPAAQSEYLAHFRADAIVRDAELLREALGAERWSVLGQSYGGLCATTYLSFAPGALREVLITGGVPALERHIDEVYAATYARVRERARRYFDRYPDDRERVRPAGRRVSHLGSMLGMSDGAESLHYVLERDPESPQFAHAVDTAMDFGVAPIYAALHEACWADGHATNWSAQRLLPEDLELTGEHVFPWMFEEIAPLRPLRDAAHLLAAREWPPLYDVAQLERNEVPVAAAVYVEDMYVEAAFSQEAIRRIPNARAWVTNEYEHNGLRADGERVLGRLLDLVRGRA